MYRIVAAVKQQLTPFNDELLINLRKKEVNGLIDYVAERYRECAAVADPNLELINYEVMSPISRLNYELGEGMKKNQVNIRADECVLVSYNFKYADKLFSVPLYIPYLYENSTIVVNGTNYECLLSMTEKLFSVRTSSHGVTIKVIRSPISFWQNTLHAFSDVITGENFVGNIVSCKLHYKHSPKTKKVKPTIVHYLLCKFELSEVLKMFNIDQHAVAFVEDVRPDDDNYYFKTKNITTSKDQIFLRVDKKLMHSNRMLHDTVSAIIYLMSGYRFVQFNELITDSKTIFMILLGKLIYNNNYDRIHCYSYMVKHIESLDSYLDNYTKNIFKANNINVKDIYSLLCFVAENIGRIIVNCPNNNMYNKRLEAINNVIIDNLVSTLYYRIYKYEKKSDIDHMTKAAIGALRVPPKHILKNLGSSDSVRFNPSIYSDNWLLTIGNKIVKRLTASNKGSKRESNKTHGSGINAPVNKFHPSMMVVESPIGFSSSPGLNCIANPYALIDSGGGFVKDEFAEQTADINKFSSSESPKPQISKERHA